jgi:predicted MPP superfamily phosphohydrolase
VPRQITLGVDRRATVASISSRNSTPNEPGVAVSKRATINQRARIIRMSRLLLFVGALGALLAIVVGVHYYLWARLVRDPRLAAPWSRLASAALSVLAASMPGAILLPRAYPDVGRTLAWPAFSWMGVMFLLLVVFLGIDVARLFAWLIRRASRAPTIDPARRTLFARVAAAATTTLVGGLATFAARAARGPIDVKRVDVALARLPRAHDGLSLVQITDVHVGPTIGATFVQDVVSRVNALSPDLVAITGDLVDGSVETLREAVAPLAGLRARHGVYFVTGNHEYFSGAAQWIVELARLGIRVLSNERVAIGAGADAFDLAGIDDASASRYGGAASKDALARALADRDPTRELVLLAHQPKQFTEAVRHGVGLQLSGHTHGGQMWPFAFIVALTQPFVAGLHRRGASQIYVSRGTGYWGPPMRLGAPAEITHVVLRRA